MISAMLAAAFLSTQTAPTPAPEPAPRADAPASDSTAADDKTAVKTVKVSKDDRVCHYEIPPGARVAKKICH
jgi:hypothetical protein